MKFLAPLTALALVSGPVFAGDTMTGRDVAVHIFAMADQNKDTTLSSAEFEASRMSSYGISFTDMDADGDGLITQAEYLAIYDRHHKPGEEA